jgi:hypothetical protein
VRIPDAIEPITAYRMWIATADGVLYSPTDAGAWAPNTWTTALCRFREHAAPHERCTCGLYAAKDLRFVLAALGHGRFSPPRLDTQPTTFVVARVHLAGKVIEHDHGYRAERARVAQILPIEGRRDWAEVVATKYGAEIAEEVVPASAYGPSARIGKAHWSLPKLESLPWLLLLLYANVVIGNITDAAEQRPWSGWLIGVAVLGGGVAIAAALSARRWLGNRFSAQLRSNAAAQPTRP